MIFRINHTNSIDILEFINRCKDPYREMYVTINRERKTLDDLNLIKKILNTQEVYVLEKENIRGILLIYREKGYRPYIKILSERFEVTRDLIKYLLWNLGESDLYIKLKKNNSLAKYLQYINPHTKKPQYGFTFAGNRGEEILLFRQGVKRLNKIGDKYAGDNK